MHDAELHFGLGIESFDGLGKSFQPIYAGDEDILHPTVLQFGQHLQPELGSLLLRHPQPQYFLLPLAIHPQHHIDRLVLHVSVEPGDLCGAGGGSRGAEGSTGAEVKAWQSRPLEEMYPIVYLDAIMVKMRDNGHVQNQAIYVVLGVDREGQKEVLGLWVAQQEGAKCWLQVLTELKNRVVKDIFIACVDGLKGFPEAIETLYPDTEVQLCIVHLVRASLNYVPWKHRKLVAADLRRIYRAATAEEARQHLEEVTLKWNAYPSVSQVWQRNWDRITPFFHYPADIRKAIYTTNSVEALHRSLRKIIKTRGAFPNEESALKLLFLAIRRASKKWTMLVQNWSQALNYFTVLWPERMSRPGGLA